MGRRARLPGAPVGRPANASVGGLALECATKHELVHHESERARARESASQSATANDNQSRRMGDAARNYVNAKQFNRPSS